VAFPKAQRAKITARQVIEPMHKKRVVCFVLTGGSAPMVNLVSRYLLHLRYAFYLRGNCRRSLRHDHGRCG